MPLLDENADYWTVYFDLNERMVKRFEQEGIQIPFNTLDVNILPAAPAAKLSKAQDKPSSKAASPAAKRSGSKSSAKKPTSDKKVDLGSVKIRLLLYNYSKA